MARLTDRRIWSSATSRPPAPSAVVGRPDLRRDVARLRVCSLRHRTFARCIVGWRVTQMALHTDLVLDALEQALYDRPSGSAPELVHHIDRGVQTRFAMPNGSPRQASSPRSAAAATRMTPWPSPLSVSRGRGHQPLWPVAARRSGRAGYPRMGRLVQLPAAPRPDRLCPSGRVRTAVISQSDGSSYGARSHAIALQETRYGSVSDQVQ